MAIDCHCPSCGANLQVAPQHAGRRVKCPKCAGVIVVPQTDAPAQLPVATPIVPPRRRPPPTTGVAPVQPAAAGTAPADAAGMIADPPRATGVTPVPPGEGSLNIVVDAEAGSLAGRRGGRKTRAAQQAKLKGGRPVWLLASGVSATVLAVVVVAVLVYRIRGGWLASTDQSQAVLVLDWPEAQRSGAAVYIDGRQQELPRSGPAEFTLKPGPHRVVMLRRGYEQIETRISLKADQRHQYQPRWTEIAAVSLGPDRFAKPAGAWLQDLEAAKRQAAGKRDILIAFEGSEPSDQWKQAWKNIFDQREFGEQMGWRFVWVRIDFPRGTDAQGQIKDLQRNKRLAETYHVSKVSMLVLTDPEGRPYYAVEGYAEEGVEDLVQRLSLAQDRVGFRLKPLLGEVQRSTGDEQRAAINEAATLLTQGLVERIELIQLYDPTLNDWQAKGAEETVFALRWLARLAAADEGDPEAIRRVVGELDDWKEKHTFKDRNRAALMLAFAALRLASAGQNSEGEKYVQEAGTYKLTDSFTRYMLARAKAAVQGFGSGSGTGFVVAASGCILTNHHVIEGAGKISVRLPDRKDMLPATVLAKDAERDLALLKIEVPEGIKLDPLRIAAAEISQGAEVGVFGFPLGVEFGTSVTFTLGRVGAKRGDGKERMLVLDCRVNPGNSGGPMCDVRGNAAGMVTAKTLSSEFLESYGMAIPAKDLLDFLVKHLPDYQEQAGSQPREDRLEWEEISRIVSPSVVMILRSQ